MAIAPESFEWVDAPSAELVEAPPRAPRPEPPRADSGRREAPRRPDPPSRRPRARRDEHEGRRRIPIGHTLVIALIALGLGALLNAHQLRKTAELRSVGAGRDFSIGLTSGLVSIADSLALERPREAVKSLLGRSSDDTIAGKVTFARHPSPRHASRPERPIVYTPLHPLRLYVTGDSLIGDPGAALLERTAGNKAIDAVAPSDSHPATGLARPEVFNWFDYVPQQVDRLRPDLVVIGFGGNDGQAIPGVPGAEVVGSASWTAEYRRRVAGMIDTLTSRGIKVVWVGLPIPRDPKLARDFRIENAIYRGEAAKRPGQVAFVNLYPLLEDSGGHYADYLPDRGGQLRPVRAADGVHYQVAGATIAARAIQQTIAKLVELRG